MIYKIHQVQFKSLTHARAHTAQELKQMIDSEQNNFNKDKQTNKQTRNLIHVSRERK